MEKEQKEQLIRIIVTAVLTAVLMLIPDKGVLPLGGIGRGFIYFFAVYLIIAWEVLKEAFEGIREGDPFDENFLMAVASLGAFALALFQGSGDYLEAVAVILFFQIGEFFEEFAVGRSRENISALMDIRPDYANVEDASGRLEKVRPEDVRTGGIIVVQPGEKVPIDGTVVSGNSSLNTVALTGESLPRDVSEGDEALSGSVNLTGVLRLRTTREFGESTVSKILALVENSSSHKSKSEDFITRFARVYTPIVCFAALALALLPPLARMTFTDLPPMWTEWLYRALTFLVISCPCALVISIPLSFFAGIGGSSREGILVKGSNVLEALSKVKTVVLDKTGTLTLGVFDVTAMHDIHDEVKTDEEEKRLLVELAALAECASTHPVGKSLQRAYAQEIDHSRVSDIKELSGRGVTALVDGREVAVGNEKLMESLGLDYCHCQSPGTIVHVAVQGRYAGHIVLGDVIKDNSGEAVQAMHRAGVKNTVMLTGDAEAVARQVAGKLGVDSYYAELLPEDKVARVEDMLSAQGEGARLAFVGDGINDAPVLMRADVGMAMGGVGSDAAIEAADVVLMDDDPMKIAKAIRISRKTLRIVRENIVFAIGIKLICLILGALGIAGMWMAVFADVGVMVIAVLNAIRALYVRSV